MSTAHTNHTNHTKKESELAWNLGGNCLDQCNRIQFSSPLQSIMASLSSVYDSGAHGVLISSVTGFYYRGYTDGVTVA